MKKIESDLKKYRTANAVFFFISGFGYSAWASRIPAFKETLALNDGMLGTLLLAMPIGLICSLPVTNYLLSRFSSKRMMLLGSLGFNFMLCLAGFINSPWQLAIILFCFGWSRNLLNLSMNAQAVSVQKLFKKSIITSFHGIWSIAGFTGAALGYACVSLEIGTQWHFLFAGLLMAALTLYQHGNTYYEAPDAKNHKTIFALPNKRLLHYAAIIFICMACENTMFDWSAIYFQKSMHVAQSTGTAAFATYMVMMTSGRFAGDRIVNHIGVGRMLRYSALLLTCGIATLVLFPYTVSGFIGCIMTGFGISCIAPLVLSLAGKSSGMSSASALASISSISYLGFLLIPPLIGFISEATDIRFAFAIIALLAASMLLLVSRIKSDDHEVVEHVEEVL